VSGANDENAASDASAPRLLLDVLCAALVLCDLAIFMRTALTPDAVSYLENAERFAAGAWSEALQGYWSPGYSLLLAPLAWLTGGNRDLFLLLAHAVQAALGLVALWLAASVVHRRVPAHARRVVFWGCAWIIVRWVTQELLTPDLLLCVLVLLFVACTPVSTRRGQVMIGLIIGCAFLVKSSIWPSLLVALVLAAVLSVRAGGRRAFPWVAVSTATVVAGLLIVPLSIRAGHPTLGSVGPLNVGWYLGDRGRRTPDLDRGAHVTRRLLDVRPGVTIAVHDLRGSTRTYAPWSDPERWAQGVPASSRPVLNWREALLAWKQNAVETARWVLPLCIGLFLVMAWTTQPRRAPVLQWLLDRPLVILAACSTAGFLVVHAEHRLLAPAGLLFLLGAWRNPTTATARPRFAWLAAALLLAIGFRLATYLPAALLASVQRAADDQPYLTFFDEARQRTPNRDVVVVGSFGLWEGILWRRHLRIAVQIGEPSTRAFRSLTEAEQTQWLRATFGTSLLGVASTEVRPAAGEMQTVVGFRSF
jgi:hypothetical protein